MSGQVVVAAHGIAATGISGARSVRYGLVGRTPGRGETLAMCLHDRELGRRVNVY
ncbi:hypothetical protein [Rhodococcus erythropolis]|uniref:hypothetical protein n=1 Tax=Rhodococcus erythropolis TaxID=1833 RepID=UPI00366CBE0E